MRINHNISSMITQGSLFKTNRSLGKNLEKLSTGLRINRASDDAAGLGVSENLRTQVMGTAQAKRNALDGIAALNIAEGAANEVSSILQRMRELAIQSANDTLTSVERGYTNQEFGQLEDEIARIALVTNYN
ncbi:MAG: flagellin, partial [Chitinispirillia bacterium]